MTTAYLSIGSNLGDRFANCILGADRVNELPGTRVVAVSKFYKTEPVDFLDQAWFVNGALKIETGIDPFELIRNLKNIELSLGQIEKEVRFGPRIIDLDIIFYGNRVICTDSLEIPHPRMDKRCFVLKPLCDIGKGVVHPVTGKSTQQLLNEIDNSHGQQVMEYTKGDMQ